MPNSFISQIEQKLQQAFAPTFLKITDDSHRHEGHQGHKPGEVTHLSIVLKSQRFQGLTLVQQHRLVYETLAQELKTQLHALALETGSED